MLSLFQRRKIEEQKRYLMESRALPMGRKEFEEWADEIFYLADIPGLTRDSCHFALAEMILHVKPTQSFETFAHFVHSLRKGAANQVAHAVFTELKEAQRARLEKKEVLPDRVNDAPKVLADAKVQSPTN